AERLGGNFLKLRDRIGRRGVRRARHGVRRLAAGRNAGPREVLARVPENDLALLPGHTEHFGGHAVHVERRVRAVVADARLELELAVRTDDEHAVETGRPARERADRHARAADLRTIPLAAARLLLVPVEQLGAFVERFLHERARDIGLLIARRNARTELGLAGGRVDPADFHLIDA